MTYLFCVETKIGHFSVHLGVARLSTGKMIGESTRRSITHKKDGFVVCRPSSLAEVYPLAHSAVCRIRKEIIPSKRILGNPRVIVSAFLTMVGSRTVETNLVNISKITTKDYVLKNIVRAAILWSRVNSPNIAVSAITVLLNGKTASSILEITLLVIQKKGT